MASVVARSRGDPGQVVSYCTVCSIILLVQIYWYRHRRRRRQRRDAPLSLIPPNEDNTSVWATRILKYVGGLFFVTLFGLAAWWKDSEVENGTSRTEVVVDLTSQVLGWLSATSYVGCRIPQILKNRHTKCTGLSFALFMFAVLGNVTFVLSNCLLSMERNHHIANAPWLAESGLTVLLDVVVLGQFSYYRSEEVRSLET